MVNVLLCVLLKLVLLQSSNYNFIFMDKKVFDKAVSLNSKKRCVEELLGRFENQDSTGVSVTVVFTNDSCMKPVSDEFRECLKCLLADYEREIEEL